MTDKRRLHIVSASVVAALLVIFLIPFDTAGRILAAAVLAAAAAVSVLLIRKRSIPSVNKQQVLMIMSVIAVVYLMLYYLTGLAFGYLNNPYALKAKFFLTRLIPAAIVIAASEVYRWVMRAQEDRTADTFCYLSCVLAEMIVCATADVATSSFGHFMELVAETMFPALLANLLYGYLTRRYGYYPNMIFRAVTTLYLYVIPVVPAISRALVAFAGLFVPLLIYLFIDSLYEKKRRYALVKKSKLVVPITVLAVAAMTITIMVISNQFSIGAHVIATGSMTGELNKGDVAIHERYEDQTIIEGQVIAFEKDGRVVIHRVVDIQIINGQARYFTKGDANPAEDSGFILDSDIVGIVNFKIPYIGYPTLWLRSLFSR
jgi:signal peptidase